MIVSRGMLVHEPSQCIQAIGAGVLADFVPPGFCPPGPNPLADIVPRTISASRY